MPTLEVLDHEIHLEQAGADGPPVVMLHGVPTNSAQWESVQERLLPHQQTYAIDLIGMGKSEPNRSTGGTTPSRTTPASSRR